MPAIRNYRGIIPAIACPFTADHRIDEPALRKLASWLAGHADVVAVMTNGHTGEVFSLTPSERATVTRIVADELRGRLPVISSIVCEGLADAAEHSRLARDAGAVALDVMPPHHWLRFGCTPRHALAYFDAIHRAAPDLDLVCHVYPAWTRAAYPSQLLADLARLPYVQAFKVGQRDMNKYARDIAAIRDADTSKSILTCHDEYLLASMVQGVDGALVGFATFIPSLIVDLWSAVKAGMVLAGVLDQGTVRPPTEAPSAPEMDALRAAVAHAGLLARHEVRQPALQR